MSKIVQLKRHNSEWTATGKYYTNKKSKNHKKQTKID